MQTEKWIIFFILALIMIVASFNLVGALTMLVLEKQKDIHVLQAMGARSWDIQKYFYYCPVSWLLWGHLLADYCLAYFVGCN